MEKRDPPAYHIGSVISGLISAVDALNEAVDKAEAVGLGVSLDINTTNGIVSVQIEVDSRK